MNAKLKSSLVNIFKWSYKTILWLVLLLILFVGIIILLYWQTDVVAEAVEKYVNITLADKGSLKIPRGNK